MLKLNELKGNSFNRKAKRVGRWNGSGRGTYCTRGCKGQNSRSGGWVAAWFEWGQTPLFRRMPKLKGFSNAVFKKEYNIINLSDLSVLADKGITSIDKKVLLENRVISKKNLGVKLLGQGELSAKIDVVVDKASATAKSAVEAKGGKVELS